MLTTLSKIKKYLGITVTTYDDVLNDLNDGISSFIESEIGRVLSDGTITEYHDGGEKDIFLRSHPVTSITTIKHNAGTQANPDWQLIDPVNYTVYYESGQVNGYFPQGHRNIQVIYVSGYSNIPNDLAMLTIKLVAREFNQRKAQGKSNEKVSDASVSWDYSFTEMDKKILGRYKTIAL